MKASLQIVVADDEPRMLQFYKLALEALGHHVVAASQTGRQLVQHCRAHQPDLVITDIKMPDMDGLEAATKIRNIRPTPLILVSAFHDDALVEKALRNHVLAYLVKPIKKADLEPAIALVIRRFKEFQALHSETDNLRQALEDRKIIERAKGVLMKLTGLDEEDAFRRLQKLASNRNEKLVVTARSILEAEEIIAGP